MLAEIEGFYENLYASHAPKPLPDASDPRSPLLTCHFTEGLPDVDEIEAALRQLSNGKALGEDGVASELLKAGSKPVLEKLKLRDNQWDYLKSVEHRCSDIVFQERRQNARQKL